MKQLATAFVGILVLLAPTVLAQQQVNQTFLTSRPIYQSGLIYFDDNTGVPGEDANSASCAFNGPDNDGDNAIWFWFVPTSDGEITINLGDSEFDTILTIFDLDLNEVACNDDDADNGGNQFTSRIENFAVTPGVYFVRISGYQGAEGPISMAVNGPVARPPGDDVVLNMPIPGVYPLSTINATPGGAAGDPVASCAPGDNSVFRFFAGTGDPVTVDFQLGGFDTVLSIFPINEPEAACNDDGGEGTLSRIADFPTEAGVNYIVRVVGFNGAEGNARLRIAFSNPTANEESTAPEVAALDAAYPNPFASRTTLPYVLPEAQDVRVVAYDVLGREVAVLAEGIRSAGRHEATFDASALPSGIYVVRLTAGKTTLTRRVTVVR